ncbi:hypothetical protein IP88_11905 [alpha proteobacterium AAP81b]|nr:hypothetical protein IP88_11905 [alpha proteobacterium AAP81b]
MLREPKNSAPAPLVMGLLALAHVAGDETLASRFLALSGLDSAELRARADDPALLAAVLELLAAHESDLVACAAAINVTPAELAGAARALAPEEYS